MADKIKLESEQLTQVTEAIARRKYSLACILLLKSVGYNPSDYIPYRTYYRALKENLPTD